MHGHRERDPDPRAPLWRGAQYFRLLAVLYAVGVHLAEAERFSRPGGAWVLLGAVIAVSAVAATGYLRGFGRRWWFVGAEFVVAAALALLTWGVTPAGFAEVSQSLPSTLWLTNPVISAAVLGGPWAGLIGGMVIAAVNAVYRGTFPGEAAGDANYPVLMAVGFGLGMAARVAARSRAELVAAERVAAEARARERLARQVHDGVLQVLALIAREPDGARPDLARLAAQQEGALRRLIAEIAEPPTPVATGTVDLREPLRQLAEAAGAVLAEPGSPVPLPAATADEVAAAVRNALENTARHAGAGARGFLLLELLDDGVAVTVRDDGVGIEPGRLENAREQGRLGVAESIVGRIAALGGHAELITGPGEGVEWELWIPTAG